MGNTEKEKVCQILKEINKFIGKENKHTKQKIKEELTRISGEKGYTTEPLEGIVPIEKIDYEILKDNDEDEGVNQILKNNHQLFKNWLTAYHSSGNGNCFYNSLSLLLTGGEDWSNNLRLACLKIILDFEEATDEMLAQAERGILLDISTNRNWSGGEEQWYLAKAINFPIITIDRSGRSLRFSWPAPTENSDIENLSHYKNKNFLWIFYTGSHYVPLIPSSEFQEVFNIKKLFAKNDINQSEKNVNVKLNIKLENKGDIFSKIDEADKEETLLEIWNETKGQIYYERGKKEIEQAVSDKIPPELKSSLDEWLKKDENGGENLLEIEKELEEIRKNNIKDQLVVYSAIEKIVKETNKKFDTFMKERETLFPFLNPTNNELEFALVNCISSVGTDYSQGINGKLPRGAALITDSGNLAKNKIKKIIHAASGSHDSDCHPTKESVILSVQNSIILAERRKIKSLAIPLIGGKIFLGYIKETSPDITLEQLAEMIVKAAIKQRNALDKDLKIVFVDFDFDNFQKILKELKENSDWGDELTKDNTEVKKGDITDFSIHKCEAIVNAANCEVEFGGGVSGDIGKKTGQSAKINHEAKELIKEYNKIAKGRIRTTKTTNPKPSISFTQTIQNLGEKLLTGTAIFLTGVYLGLIAYWIIKKSKIRINLKKRK